MRTKTLFSLLVASAPCAVFGSALRAAVGGGQLAVGEGSSDEVIISDISNIGNFQYILDVNVGGQILKSVVDTGSFSLITTSKQCPSEHCPQRAFDPNVSSTYRQLEFRREAIFGSGSIQMRAAEDEMRFGPGFGPSKARFWEMVDMGERMKALWETVEFDSILGMAWTAKVPKKGEPGKWTDESTFLELFDVHSFTVCLGDAPLGMTPTAPTPSRLYWGPPGAYPFEHPFHAKLQVVGHGHWSVKLSNVEVWRQDQKEPWKGPCWDEECAALIDTGTAVLTAPSKMFLRLTDLTGPIRDDCRNFEQLPSIRLRLGEGDGALDVTLTPDMYVEHLKYKDMLANPPQVVERCTNMWVPDDLNSAYGAFWVLGSPFMRKFLWEFDRRKKEINVAEKPARCPGEPKTALTVTSSKSHIAFQARPNGREVGREGRPVDARRLLGLDGLGDL